MGRGFAALEYMKIHRNTEMNSRQIRKFCEIDDDSEALLETAMASGS